ncbi:MAG: NAD-dependent epimerase/dehydratase family protein [bacterium]|nr:NAD-dependent epimerase/dehydratase family protein [bacterium]
MSNNLRQKTRKKKGIKILVTGGAGFLGIKLIAGLKKAGYKKIKSFDIVSGQNLLNKGQVDNAIKNSDVVFHLAAVADLNYARKHPRESMDINVVGTINVADACAKYNKTLNFASTCCAYGNQEKHPITEDNPPRPTELYAHSKLAGENIIQAYASQFGFKYNILRLATFYGEGMRPALAPFIFLQKAIRHEPITVHGTGKQTRTFTHVSDVVDAMIKILEKGVVNEIINITTEEEISVNNMAKMAISVANSKSDIKFTADRPGQIYTEKHSAKKAARLLDWEAKIPFEKGFNEIHKWMSKDHKSVDGYRPKNK